MHERLVELWLDSAGERSFQAPFCQALAHRGYTILHNTRHAPLELGKDVIARTPSGALAAYQLKGHPGSRMTLTEARKVYPQLIELVSTPIMHAGAESASHESYLVTNGEIDEEARIFIDQFNVQQVRAGYPLRTVGLITRGQLLGWFSELGHSLWPSEIEDIAALAEIMALDGRGHAPTELLGRLLQQVLALTEDISAASGQLGKDAIGRRVTSGAILVSVAMSRFDKEANHAAMVDAWTLFATYAIACLERNKRSATPPVAEAIAMARATVRRYLALLARELIDVPNALDGNGSLANGVLFQARATLVAGLLSVLYLWCEREGWTAEVSRPELLTALHGLEPHLFLWGESAIPQFLAYYWHAKAASSSWQVDRYLYGILDGTTPRWRGDDWTGLAPPDFGYETVAKHMMRSILRSGDDPLEKEALGSSSCYLYTLFLLMVRANLKTSCRMAWPGVSRAMRRQFIPEDPWRYCLHRTKFGVYHSDALPRTLKWSDAVAEATVEGCTGVPPMLAGDAILLLLHCIFRPWRGTQSVVLHLGRSFGQTWY